jgi:hypothetical protein
MKKKQIPINLIDKIKKIYSGARIRLNHLHEPINVNRGVLQGSIISPILFNLYIDDLVESLDQEAYEVLAYADDIAVLWKDEEQLLRVMDILEKWSINTCIGINKEKSGILIVQNT